MSPLLVAVLLLGALAGIGLTLVAAQLVPAPPDLDAALERLSTQRPSAPDVRAAGLQDRLGRTLLARGGALPGLRPPIRELAILRIAPHEWLGEKALLAVIGLAFPPLLAGLLTVAGIGLPWPLPTLAALGLAVVFFVLPSLTLRERAA